FVASQSTPPVAAISPAPSQPPKVAPSVPRPAEPQPATAAPAPTQPPSIEEPKSAAGASEPAAPSVGPPVAPPAAVPAGRPAIESASKEPEPAKAAAALKLEPVQPRFESGAANETADAILNPPTRSAADQPPQETPPPAPIADNP